MKRSLLWLGSVLAGLVLTSAGHAFSLDGEPVINRDNGTTKIITGTVSQGKSAPLLFAQSTADNAVQVDQLQEQVRKLNGKVEELTFQLLQLQEQLRKMQEDNEFRFQELEDKRSDAGDSSKPRNSDMASGDGDQRLGKSQPSEGVPSSIPSGGNNTSKATAEAGRVLGSLPSNLGTLKFDANGNVIDGAVGKPLDLTALRDPSLSKFNEEGGTEISNLKPGLLLARGRDFYDAGDYVLAERTLRTLVKSYPEDNNRAEAQHWLGRALFARGDFHGAATVFLDTHNTYPDAKRAPDTMLRLGLSMAGLNQREIACATYAEVLKQYPNASDNVKKQVVVERTSAGC